MFSLIQTLKRVLSYLYDTVLGGVTMETDGNLRGPESPSTQGDDGKQEHGMLRKVRMKLW